MDKTTTTATTILVTFWTLDFQTDYKIVFYQINSYSWNIQGEPKKVTPLRLLHIFPFAAILRRRKLIMFFAIHIRTYLIILVHLSKYVWELPHFL